MRSGKNSRKFLPMRVARSQKKTDLPVEIFGTAISGTQQREVLRKLWLQRKELLHVATVNSEFVMEARRNATFSSILTHCLTVADGWGVVWALRLAPFAPGKHVERISGTELVDEILAHAAGSGEKVFLLGARDGVAERAAAEMSKKYPGLHVSWFAGARTVSVEKGEEASMTIAKINAFEPDYLLVAYGSPWQDIWIEANRPYLRARVAMGVGGVLDEWAGTVATCPSWLDRMGLKWLWRFTHEPWRWRRIMTVWQFAFLVLYHKLID